MPTCHRVRARTSEHERARAQMDAVRGTTGTGGDLLLKLRLPLKIEQLQDVTRAQERAPEPSQADMRLPDFMVRARLHHHHGLCHARCET